jgi:hypothetical protein
MKGWEIGAIIVGSLIFVFLALNIFHDIQQVDYLLPHGGYQLCNNGKCTNVGNSTLV